MQEIVLPYFHTPAQLVSPGTANLLQKLWDGGRAVGCATLHPAAYRDLPGMCRKPFGALHM